MKSKVYRSINESIRSNCSWEERWKGEDKGLIQCWETGRQRGSKHPELRELAQSGVLPVSDWKGGVKSKLKAKFKYGTLNYLAEWQGLREEDLDIDFNSEIELTCSRTGMKIVFTADTEKYSNAEYIRSQGLRTKQKIKY